MLEDKKSFGEELVRVFTENGMGSLLNGERVEKFARLTEIMLTENEK